ncbi:NB-ARC domain-containing protein [Chamaesiphon sp. VAR_48_metabat_135_sub]|uniref:NB-ARC domain-containing protein n=1 Tax=Chamaesiphon sp. VAR_48_metabat_135_sub TaxID=2964699 RepID=UPI00286C62F2|nr:NB-ARC domain-containing protein [Chamaesiphon sp. VAR_48_metabat_135_sub]
MNDAELMSEEDFDRSYREFIRQYSKDSTRFQLIRYRLQGLTNAEVAASLEISKNTVRQYLSDVYTQFSVNSFQDLQALFDRYPQIWNPEYKDEIVTKIAEIRTQFNNLPIHHCRQPIGREGDIDRLLKSIDKYNLIWVKGIGGCGKTTTLLEVANRCLDGAIKFDAIVYISAQTEGIINNRRIALPAQRTLVDIYRQIFNTFDRGELMYGSISTTGDESNYDHLHDCLCQLLQQYRTLLIFDNFDTDENYYALRQAIHRLPASTRILVGSRQVFDRNYHLYELQFLAPTDAEKLIRDRLRKRQCKLTDRQIDLIVKYTGGLPLAIEFTVGLVAIPGRDVRDLERFFSSNPYPQNLLDYCLEQSIKQLRQNRPDWGYQIIQAIALFPDSAPREALIKLTKLTKITTGFDRSIEQLLDLSLIISVEQDRYTLHPVVRAYLNNILISQPATTNHLRQLWMQWYYDKFVKEFDESNWHDWQDYRSLELEWNNLAAVVDWCFYSSPHLYQQCIDFWNSLKGFTLFRGRWQERKQWLEWLIKGAELQADRETLALALYHQSLTIACIDETDRQGKARDLALAAWELGVDFNDRFNLVNHIAALEICQQTPDSFALAKKWLEDALNLSNDLSNLNLAQIKYHQAQVEFGLNNADLSESLYQTSLALAQSESHQRLTVLNQGGLAKILMTKGEFDRAKILLLQSLDRLIENKDARPIAICYAYLAMLSQKQENYDEWMKWRQLAIEKFQQLNMHQQAGEFAKMQFTAKQ